MRIPVMSHRIFFFALYCVCLFLRATCNDQLTRDGNSEYPNYHRRVIASEKKPAAYGETFVKLPPFFQKNFEQKSTEEIALKNQQPDSSQKNKLPISDDKLSSIVFRPPKMTDFERNEQVSSRKLNRRSVEEGKKKGGEQDTRDAGFSSRDRSEDQHSRERQVDADTLGGKVEELAKNFKSLIDNQRLGNFSNLLRFNNGHLEIVGLPGQPVKKIFSFILDKIKPKSKPETDNKDQQPDQRLARRFLEHGRNILSNMKENAESAKVGIHQALKMGPLSVNFDVGKP